MGVITLYDDKNSGSAHLKLKTASYSPSIINVCIRYAIIWEKIFRRYRKYDEIYSR